MSTEIEKIIRESNLNAKWDSLNRKVLLVGELYPEKLSDLANWEDSFLQKMV